MSKPLRNLVVVGGGVALAATNTKPNAITNAAPTQLELWLTSDELAELAGCPLRTAQHGIKSRRFMRQDIHVREEASNVGRGGKVLKVHVDSLPPDLRAAWYLAHGIDLHEKRDPTTGETLLIPEQKFKRDARHEKALRLARWKHDVIRPALQLPANSSERAAKLAELSEEQRRMPDGKRATVPLRTLYHWVQCYEQGQAGLAGLIQKPRKDAGSKRLKVTRIWDRFMAEHLEEHAHDQIAETIQHYIRSLWASGERGWRAISEKSTTKLIELSRDLKIISFEALPLGRPVLNAGTETQFELCFVNRRRVEEYRDYSVIAVKNKDNARFQDEFMPHIMRDYSGYKPRDIVVGDVHPVDVMMRRKDGSIVYPKAISWLDIATNEIHMTFVLLEKGEGVKREHVAMAFEAMVAEWGLPKLLYLDNGSEYKWAEMIDGFTRLSKLSEGAFAIHDLDERGDVAERVIHSREAVLRSLAYNAKGKPKIEGAFGNIEKVQFALLPGWTAGDRMSKKTHAKGKDPEPFPGTAQEFLSAASTMLEWYHKRPQHGRLSGRSPNEALREFIQEGWGKTVLGNHEVLALAFAEEVSRIPNSGRVSYRSRHGETHHYYSDALLNMQRAVTLRVPAYRPDFVFLFDGERYLGIARPERSFGVLDAAGANELGRRKKYYLREVREMAKHCALLDLVSETERHNAHMADTPEAPIAATIDAGALERMAIAAREEREAMARDLEGKPRKEVSQWKTGPNELVQNVEWAEDE